MQAFLFPLVQKQF